MAVNVDVAKLTLPVLEVMSEVAWREYKQKYSVYRLRGGEEPIRRLLGLKAIRHLKVYVPDVDLNQVSNGDLTKELDKLYAPKSRSDTMAKLKAVRMGDNAAWQMEEVVEYAAEFRAVLESAPDSVKPVDTLIV